jgi:7-keto-8-aminopelargonate synthetase-like enzyme
LLTGAKTQTYAIAITAQRWAQSFEADKPIVVTSDGRVLGVLGGVASGGQEILDVLSSHCGHNLGV